ncbi:MAG TPA: formylglycine-generating enzyme family protein, partial [Bryobacterales bacterium]|nr:formylglycine-generating enzyme family protein [Bryobacterales bacterium]
GRSSAPGCRTSAGADGSLALFSLSRAPFRKFSLPPEYAHFCHGLLGVSVEAPVKRTETGINPDDYVLIPAGRFKMGAVPGDEQAADNEKPQHEVQITKAFYLKKTPVTVGEYKRFAEETGREMPKAPEFNQGWEKEDHPIVEVAWEDARTYCEWAGRRLPTEAEWEYAARGGQEGLKYPNGDELTKQDAHFQDKGTAPMGQYPANGYDLHDMAGNAWEWVADWYGEDYYKNSPDTDPKGPDSGEYRVLRGGSWRYSPGLLRASFRFRIHPVSRLYDIGFRCAREVVP